MIYILTSKKFVPIEIETKGLPAAIYVDNIPELHDNWYWRSWSRIPTNPNHYAQLKPDTKND